MKPKSPISTLSKADILLRFELRHIWIFLAYVLLMVLQLFVMDQEWFTLVFAFFTNVFLFLFIRYYYDPIRTFLHEYGSYFSISALYIVLMGFLLLSIDQMDILIVDLFERSSEQGSRNLAFFALFQFPVSISIVWYMPYYLFFSDNFYARKEEGEHILKADAQWWDKVRFYFHILLPIRTLHLHNEHYVQKLTHLDPKNRRVFHNTRRFLGAVYILTLTGLITHILNAAGWTDLTSEWALLIGLGVMLIFQGPIWYRTVYFRREGAAICICKQPLPRQKTAGGQQSMKAGSEKKQRPFAALWLPLGLLSLVALVAMGSIYLETKLENWDDNLNFFNGIMLLVGILFTWGISKLFSRKLKVSRKPPNEAREIPHLDWHAISVLVVFGITVILLLFILLGKSLIFLDNGHPWDLMVSYLLFNYLFLYCFMGMAYYRRFWKTHVFIRKPYLNQIGRTLDEFITPVIMLLNFFMAVLFVAAFAGGLFHFKTILAHKVHVLNPINIFFIFINGMISLLALIDRIIFLRDQQIILAKKRAGLQDFALPRTRLKVAAFSLALFMVGFYFIKRGNEYHTLSYIESPGTEEKQMYDLRQYTQQFLDRRDSSRKPIVMIAADGGGIKAAYWTLKVMKHLEDSLGIYDQDVFLTSGASGGSIGLGMYAYLKAQGLDAASIDGKISQLGERNFLNADFAGLLSRWPINMVPDAFLTDNPDRMDVMAMNYLNIAMQDSTYAIDSLLRHPFAYLWTRNQYRLPLYITNTSRMEDGRKGITHPLAYDPSLTRGMVDLSSKLEGGKRKYLSFPDALFTTNRFPVFSPIAEIEGKGHFFDAGVVDNSGVGTILQFLQYMEGQGDSVFQQFLQQPIILISIRTAKSRYIYEKFNQFQESLSETQHLLYASAVLSVISNDGMTGIPLYFDDLMNDTTMRQAYHITTFYPITLPFKIEDEEEVVQTLYGETADTKTKTEIESLLGKLNAEIVAHYRHPPGGKGDPIMLEPPLGRMLAGPARDYMNDMSLWQTQVAIDSIRSDFPQ